MVHRKTHINNDGFKSASKVQGILAMDNKKETGDRQKADLPGASDGAGFPSAAEMAALTAQSDAASTVDEEEERRKTLPPAALRALAEAEERRKAAAKQAPAEPETGGRGGLDPARFGDWEIKGRAIDF